ncbi:uncharacterized protein [Venturia canescens]|uniref:uncharacterized protein n=1 Tax=Venturia canescens TaxID=32260 RepID=UPI001C9D389B|nr:uncharacterized protein LOC122417894 [Venturia canescens]XP_043288333.1 uncharacterized protein LOC122418263 [Venturia canescens]
MDEQIDETPKNGDIDKTNEAGNETNPSSAKINNANETDIPMDHERISTEVLVDTANRLKKLTLAQNSDDSGPSTSKSEDGEQKNTFERRHRGNRAGRRVQERRRIGFLAKMLLAMSNDKYRDPPRRYWRGGYSRGNNHGTS